MVSLIQPLLNLCRMGNIWFDNGMVKNQLVLEQLLIAKCEVAAKKTNAVTDCIDRNTN